MAQTNPFNESAIRTVVVVAITSNTRLGSAPGNVRCQLRETGLARESVANVSRVVGWIRASSPSALGRFLLARWPKSRTACDWCLGFET